MMADMSVSCSTNGLKRFTRFIWRFSDRGQLNVWLKKNALIRKSHRLKCVRWKESNGNCFSKNEDSNSFHAEVKASHGIGDDECLAFTCALRGEPSSTDQQCQRVSAHRCYTAFLFPLHYIHLSASFASSSILLPSPSSSSGRLPAETLWTRKR